MGELAPLEDPFVVGLLGEEGQPEQLERADVVSSPSPMVQQDDGDMDDSAVCDPWCRARGGASSSISTLTVGGDDDDELAVQPSCE
jgi:hypothetical protein